MNLTLTGAGAGAADGVDDVVSVEVVVVVVLVVVVAGLFPNERERAGRWTGRAEAGTEDLAADAAAAA